MTKITKLAEHYFKREFIASVNDKVITCYVSTNKFLKHSPLIAQNTVSNYTAYKQHAVHFEKLRIWPAL